MELSVNPPVLLMHANKNKIFQFKKNIGWGLTWKYTPVIPATRGA
jgi:hypothetical protein